MSAGRHASHRAPGGAPRPAWPRAARSAAILLGALLAASLAGCGRRAGPPRVSYVLHHSIKTYGDCTHGREQCTRITLGWPVIAAAPTPAGADSINAFVRAALCQPYDGGAPLASEDSVTAGFIEAYREFVASTAGAPATAWQFERRIEPLGDTLGVASLAVTETGFLGGAHPNSTTRFANFDVRTGRMLTRSDLLLDSGREQLDRIGERSFRRVRHLAPNADLGAAGFWFENGRFKLNENFAVTPGGLLFFFNDYEIAPHSFGATSIALPWADVMPLVRTDGPLWQGGRR